MKESINIDILAIGDYQYNEENKISNAFSSSVLIKSNDRLIVVDTSSKFMKPSLKTSFKQLGVYPKDVDTVILTHSHYDHIENNDMFQNAEIIMHSGEEETIPGVKLIDKDMEIARGIRLVHTPGHTPGSMCVFIESDIKYVIAGDTLPRLSNFEKMTPPGINYDPVLALESIKKVVTYADMVIPGHGHPFMTER